jgi:hypothetical protein
MADGKWISYPSCFNQSAWEIGAWLRRSAVADFLNGGSWSLVKEFVEVESGKRSDRSMLAKAVRACRAYGAKLVIDEAGPSVPRCSLPARTGEGWHRPRGC